jgi:hypothetical protein
VGKKLCVCGPIIMQAKKIIRRGNIRKKSGDEELSTTDLDTIDTSYSDHAATKLEELKKAQAFRKRFCLEANFKLL